MLQSPIHWVTGCNLVTQARAAIIFLLQSPIHWVTGCSFRFSMCVSPSSGRYNPYTLGHWLQPRPSRPIASAQRCNLYTGSLVATLHVRKLHWNSVNGLVRTSLDNAVNPPFAQHPPCLACIQTPAQPVFPSFCEPPEKTLCTWGSHRLLINYEILSPTSTPFNVA